MVAQRQNASVEQEVVARYESAFATLANRCIAEPYNFHRIAPMLSPGILKSDLQAAKIVSACLSVYAEHTNYTPQRIALACNIPAQEALRMSQLDAEIDLPEAMEVFLFYHGQWAEMRVSKLVEGWVMRGLGSEEIQVEAAKARKELGLSARLSSSDGKEEFEKRLFAAIDGIKFEFPVAPFLASVREKIPYYEPGDYVVVPALTGTGKTYYALNQIHYISIKGVPSCLINLENTPANMQKRMWQMHSKIRFRPDLRGSDEQIRYYLKAWEEVKAMPFRSYNPGPSLPAIVSAIRQDWNERRIQLAVVDYAQLINIPGYRGNRNYELGEISATFRALALELQIPVIVLAQMKQEVAKTSDKRGGLYDIKDCANFAQDATLVQCLYRPEVFDIATRELANGSIEPYPEKYADVFIAKGREIGIALCEARFDPVFGFYDAQQATQFPSAAYTKHYSLNVPRPDFDEDDLPF